MNLIRMTKLFIHFNMT